jgi:hypothetical protein
MTMGRRWFAGVCLVTVAPGALTVAAVTENVAVATEVSPVRVSRVECEPDRGLRLRRFEDRSAQLLCGRRVIVRVSVPD